MIWLKRIFWLFIILSLLLVGLWFSSENVQPVEVVLLGFSMPKMNVGVLLPLVLLLGALLGFVLSLGPLARLQNRNLSLQRKLGRRERELQSLRKAPLQYEAGLRDKPAISDRVVGE